MSTAVRNGSSIIWIYKNIQKYSMFALFTLNTTGARKQYMIIKTYKELLGTCFKSKRQHIYTVYTKSTCKNTPM